MVEEASIDNNTDRERFRCAILFRGQNGSFAFISGNFVARFEQGNTTQTFHFKKERLKNMKKNSQWYFKSEVKNMSILFTQFVIFVVTVQTCNQFVFPLF